MSSATSTDKIRPDAPSELQPWQFFVLVALACATAVTFMVRGQSLIPVLLLTVLMGTVVLVGLAALRTVKPLLSDDVDETPMIGERTRSALEREKMLALRAIKELEFDRAMGKIGDDDFRDMTGRLRSRAGRLMRQLEAGSGYRDQIELEVTKRLGAAPSGKRDGSSTLVQARACGNCTALNDLDAKFCKSCGTKLVA